MKIIAISDTHEQHEILTEKIKKIKPDMIIHAGDGANPRERIMNEIGLRAFLSWLSSFKDVKHKIYVPGNHDTSFESGLIKKEEYPEIIFLVNETIEIEGIKIFGSPITPSFGQGWAYNCPRNKIDKYWELIPENTDIVITHGPPKSILDLDVYYGQYSLCGCISLLNRIKEVKPKYHIFGHIHDNEHVKNSGTKTIDAIDTIFVNASIVDLRHNPINQPKILEI